MKHLENKFVEVKSVVDCNGILLNFNLYLEAWANYGGNSIKEVNPKQIFYNTGPTAYDKKRGYKLSTYWSEKRGEDAQIFTIWFRNDGLDIRVFKWTGTEEEFDNYVPEDKTPYAIHYEIGFE